MTRSLLGELGTAAASVDHVREVLGFGRPVMLADVLDEFRKPVVLDTPIVTDDGVALGGSHRITLERDGTYRYQGSMRATGFPSFTYVVRATVDGEGPPAVLVAQGVVHGSNEPGSRVSRWNQRGVSEQVSDHWLGFRHATLRTEMNHDTDWFGVLDDWAVGLLASTAVFGNPLGIAIVLGSQLVDALDVPELAIPGLAGVIVAGGVVMVWGPGAILAAVVAGIAAGAIVEAAVDHRTPTEAERRFAERVYGTGIIPWDRVVLTNLLGASDRPFTMPSVGGAVLIHLGLGYSDPMSYTGKGATSAGSNAPGQLFIHELCHVWQIEYGDFVPGWICRGATSSQYRYGSAGASWRPGMNIEQQATVVDEWFAGSDDRNNHGSTPNQQAYAPRQEDDGNPYFRYVRDHVRRGVDD